jgi:hypothetical protein
MQTVLFFISMCLLGGLGGLLGSILGASLGSTGLFVGGFLGGILIAPLAARVAMWRGWIERAQFWPTAAGTAIGFVAAALVAVNTLSSPVGPILGTSLIGIGALIGARTARRRASALSA